MSIRILGLDFETSGLDTGKDRIVEIGAVLWENGKPLQIFNCFVDPEGLVMPPEVTAINGITDEMLSEFGQYPEDAFRELDDIASSNKVDYICAHNGENFDRPFLLAELARLHGEYDIREIPWIDTRTDLPWEKEPTSRRLNHLAADFGFINPFAHRAVFDVLTMLRILDKFDIAEVLAYQKIPFVTMQAQVTYDNRQLAKDQRFSWEQIGEKRYPKMWVKRIKQNRIEAERTACKFEIKELPA